MGSGSQDYTWLSDADSVNDRIRSVSCLRKKKQSDPDSVNGRIRSVSCLRKNNRIRIPETAAVYGHRILAPELTGNKPEMDTGTDFGYGRRKSVRSGRFPPYVVHLGIEV